MNSLLTTLAARSRLTVADTAKIVRTAPKRYKVYTIPRKSKGDRLIAHPARELKVVQRALVGMFEGILPVSEAATAYERGCSVKANAAVHKDADWIAKFDLRNFFNSIHEDAWAQFLENAQVDQDRIELSRKVFFWGPRHANRNCLSVGAPSSPFASNRFMYDYDTQILEFCNKIGFNYSRYADDMTISGTGQMDFDSIHAWLRGVIEGPGVFNLNEEKSRFLDKGMRRSVTGVVITNDGNLSIGRNRRRRLEARLHNYVIKNEDDDINVLRGELAFFKMIDPTGFQRLANKFGESKRAHLARLF